MTKKDSRKSYTYEPVEIENTFIYFDGRFNPELNQLKIYRLYGDTCLFEKAIKKFCEHNHITKAVIL